MPSPKKCASQFPKGSKAYNDCVNYKNVKKMPGQQKMSSPKKGY